MSDSDHEADKRPSDNRDVPEGTGLLDDDVLLDVESGEEADKSDTSLACGIDQTRLSQELELSEEENDQIKIAEEDQTLRGPGQQPVDPSGTNLFNVEDHVVTGQLPTYPPRDGGAAPGRTDHVEKPPQPDTSAPPLYKPEEDSYRFTPSDDKSVKQAAYSWLKRSRVHLTPAPAPRLISTLEDRWVNPLIEKIHYLMRVDEAMMRMTEATALQVHTEATGRITEATGRMTEATVLQVLTEATALQVSH